MFERKEHTDEPIVGEEAVKRYAQEHEKNARSMYGPFLKRLELLDPRGAALEVGAGVGTLTSLVARRHPGLRITAFDYSPHMVDLARASARQNGLDGRIGFACADVHSEKEVRRFGTFDLIYSAYSLHHWRDPRVALNNLWGALKDGGRLCILDLRRVWWLYLLPGSGGFLSSIRASYRPGEIAEILGAAGITDHVIETSFPGFIQTIVARK